MMNLILSGLILTKHKENEMKITEVIKIANELTNGVLYNVIELMPTEYKKCST